MASATGGAGHTQCGRARYEFNIDGICANTAAAKGRVERAHLTMQDRLVKELRLQGISTVEAANAGHPVRELLAMPGGQCLEKGQPPPNESSDRDVTPTFEVP
jgi:hypothetical protein